MFYFVLGFFLNSFHTLPTPFPFLQVSGGGDRGGSEHACRSAHRTGAVWRAGPQEMAV